MICTEPYKRKLIPDRADYSCFTTKEDGVWVLKNGNGNVLYSFIDKSDCTEKAQSIVDSLMELYFIKQREFEIHQTSYPQYYYKAYNEANWAHKALYKGFKESTGKDFNPYHNWFGCSLYSPDRELIRDKKTITLSLQGMSMRNPPIMTDGIKKIMDERACKYICFINEGSVVYEDWTGKLPEMGWIENFIQ